jgi:hypothetical protein
LDFDFVLAAFDTHDSWRVDWPVTQIDTVATGAHVNG